MISAANRQLLSNGSRSPIIYILLVLFVLASCGTPSPTTTGPSSTRSENNPGSKSDSQTQETSSDTITIVAQPDDIEITDETLNESNHSKIRKTIKLALLLPIGASLKDSSDFEDHDEMEGYYYYQGFNMAVQEMNSEDQSIEVRLVDTKGRKADQYEEDLREDYDIWVGGKTKEEDQFLGEIPRGLDQIYVNPFRVINPLYAGTNIQLEPSSILTQLEYIAEYCYTDKTTGPITVVVEKGDENRIKAFKSYIQTVYGVEAWSRFRELVIDDETPHLEDTELDEFYDDYKASAFILPYTSGGFMRTFLRKLKTDQGERKTVVYGLHHWMSNEDIDLGFYESMEIRIATWYYPRYEQKTYRAFERNYFNTYGQVPTTMEIVKGYDHGRFLMQCIERHGVDASKYNSEGPFQGLFWSIDLVNLLEDSGAKLSSSINYSNSALKMFRYQKGVFAPIN